MSDIKLSLNVRTATGKKVAGIRADGLIPSVIYGEGEPVLAQSAYNETEKVLLAAGYHSTIDIDIDGKKKMVIVKDVNLIKGIDDTLSPMVEFLIILVSPPVLLHAIGIVLASVGVKAVCDLMSDCGSDGTDHSLNAVICIEILVEDSCQDVY